MPYIGRLGSLGIAKENAVGTLNSTMENWIAFNPPETITPNIKLLEHNGIAAKPDYVIKASQGPGDISSGKFNFNVEPENIGEVLMGAFGTDTVTDAASVTIDPSNHHIDLTVDGGAELNAIIASGTYAYGTSASVAASLCLAIKTALEAVATGRTFTVTYSYSTKKFTTTIDGIHTHVFKWATGTNNATGAYAILGYTKADTTDTTAHTSDSATAIPALIHTFTRLSSAQLPTYSFFLDKGAEKFLFAGGMLNKLTIDAKAGEYVKADADYVILRYDSDGTGTATYSTLKPFTFNEVSVNFAGSSVEVDYDNIKIEIDNMVKAEHALSSSIWPNKIYSEGFRVTIAADFFLENTTEYAKFIAGTNTSLVITITSSEKIVGTVPYSLTFNLPVGKYSAAPYQINAGVLKVPFSLVGIYDTATTKTMNAVLQNSKPAAY